MLGGRAWKCCSIYQQHMQTANEPPTQCALTQHDAACLTLLLQVWPNLGLHYALTAKLAMFLQQPGTAAAAAGAAAGILQVTHPGSSPVLAEVMQLRCEAQQEVAAMERMRQG
jgi:hypothetical protein